MSNALMDACKLGLVIAVSGKPGSGKSTLAKALAERFGLRYVSLGMIFRRLAHERGMSLEEFSRLAEKDRSIDELIDAISRREGKRGCVVIDGHISAWILADIAHAKILVYAPTDVRATRIAQRDGRSIEDALRELEIRDASEARRYRKYYGIDVDDISVFDIAINTATFSRREMIELASKAVELILKRLSGKQKLIEGTKI